MAVPYSDKILGILPWYSFLIVVGASLAIFLASREEKRFFSGKENIVDLALWVLPCGIVGARAYYVAFSWSSFKHDFWSVFRIWEGGLAIYGAIIAGLLTVLIFSRVRKVPALRICDFIAPGLVLAQAIGRWGNYFNMEAFGAEVTNPAWQFFPFAVKIVSASGTFTWHMATFFYESFWNLLVFIFLLFGRRKLFRRQGDVFSFYAFLYACGRLVVEELRMDSLYAGSAVRVSQLLSVIVCVFILLRFLYVRRKKGFLCPPCFWLPAMPSLLFGLFMILFCTGCFTSAFPALSQRFLLLLLYSAVNILTILAVYGKSAPSEVLYACNERKESAV